MKNVTLETILKFEGFYDSIHSENIDDIVSRLCEEYAINETDLEIDYKNIYVQYAQKIVELFNKETGASLQYLNLVSPKYYNFETDKIEISFKRKDILKFKQYLKDAWGYDASELKDIVEDYIRYWTTQRDGFIPFNTYNDVMQDYDLFCEFQMDALFQVFRELDAYQNIIYSEELDNLIYDLVYSYIEKYNNK